MAGDESPQLTDTNIFLTAAVTEFAFLESRFGFQRATSGPLSISYENGAHYVSITLDQLNEVQIWFGRCGTDDLPGDYSLETGDLLQLPCASSWRWDGAQDGIGGWLAQLANLLELCADAGLFSDASTIKAMKAGRDSNIAVWHRHERERPLREKAARAWQSKDYQAVVDALRGVSLTEREARRFQYAIKQI